MTSITASESAGATLLKALINEIRQLHKPWEQTPEREQEVVIDRLRRAVESAVRSAVGVIAGGSFTRIQATVDQVVFKDGVKAVLLLPKGQGGTHELADAQGNNVMVVIASAAEHLEHMETVRADADQPDLFEGDTQAAAEPKPVSPEWQALIESLELAPPDDGTPAKSMHQQCRDLLEKVHVYVPPADCEQWSEQELLVAAHWAIEYAKDPEGCKIARPHWLPLPDPIPSMHTRVWGSVEGQSVYVDVPNDVYDAVARAWVEAAKDGVPGYDDYVQALRARDERADGDERTED